MMDYVGTIDRKTYSRISIGVHFFLLGALNGNWASILPSVQTVQEINDQALGEYMSLSIIGCMIGLPLIAHISEYFGSYVSLTIGIAVYAAVYPLLAIKNSLLFGFFMFLTGMLSGIADAAMNVQAIICKTIIQAPTIGLFHACYAVGALIGAFIGGIMIDNGVEVFYQSFYFGCCLLLVQCGWYFGLYSYEEEKESKAVQTQETSFFPPLLRPMKKIPNLQLQVLILLISF